VSGSPRWTLIPCGPHLERIQDKTAPAAVLSWSAMPSRPTSNRSPSPP